MVYCWRQIEKCQFFYRRLLISSFDIFFFFAHRITFSCQKLSKPSLSFTLRSREMRNRKLLMAMPLKTWIVMWQKRDAQTGQSLLQALQRTMPGLGMQIGPPQQVVPLWARTTKNTD